jgi:hypothetical protein
MNSLQKFVLLVIGIIILVIWIEWIMGKAIGTCLSKETGVALGVILIVLAVPNHLSLITLQIYVNFQLIAKDR